jgi:hypothetical protein
MRLRASPAPKSPTPTRHRAAPGPQHPPPPPPPPLRRRRGGVGWGGVVIYMHISEGGCGRWGNGGEMRTSYRGWACGKSRGHCVTRWLTLAVLALTQTEDWSWYLCWCTCDWRIRIWAKLMMTDPKTKSTQPGTSVRKKRLDCFPTEPSLKLVIRLCMMSKTAPLSSANSIVPFPGC